MVEESGATAGDALRIQVLGGFRVVAGPRALDEHAWGLRKASALVKLLALTSGHRLHRERVIDALWPELSLLAGNNSLHRTLHAARRALNPGRPAGARARYLTLHGDILGLGPSGRVVVDADVFHTAVVAARHSRDAAAYRHAIALYGGDLLPDDLYDDWSTAAREELRELYCALLAEAARSFAAAAPDEAIQTLRRLIAVEPTREDAHAALMRLLAHSGRRYDALRQYQMLRAILCDELAAEPDASTQRLYEEIQARTFPPAQAAVPVDAAARDAHVAGIHQRESLPSHAADDTPRAAEQARAAAEGVAAAEPMGSHVLFAAPADALTGYVTSFVGRVREHEELSDLLAANRLVTVVGPGGCGKTRLALHTAESLRQTSTGTGGVTLVELGALGDAALVPQAVALALGIREQADRPLAETLTAALAPLRVLLVLDNCEHVRDACARLADELLAACPQVRILATSRRPLAVHAEAIFRLRPLATPDPDALPPFAALLDYDAIHLFVERAVASRPGFTLNAKNADAVVRVCRRLDGLPLAIELAAARRRVLTVAQIAARLDDALALLGGGPDEVPRHATLRAAIGWSWELLLEPERILLRRLAVFAGGWTLDAAEAICGDSPSPDEDTAAPVSPSPGAATSVSPSPRRERGPGGEDPTILDLLARLVEQSLVVAVEQGDTMHYRLLETIRQYAAVQLRAAGEEEMLRQRHACWLLDFVLAAEAGLQGSEQDAWLTRLDAENDNLRAALEWACAAGEIELAARIAGPAARYWHLRGTLREGRRWLERILALDDARGRIAPAAVRALVLQQIGLLAQFQTDLVGATAACEESLRLWRELGDRRGMDESLSVLGGAAESRGDYQRAAQLYGESLELAREQGDLSRVTLGLSNVADQLLLLGNLTRAEALYTESLALARRIGNRRYTAMALTNLGRVALRQGDVAAAEAPLERGLAIMRALNIPRGAGEALLPLGVLALARGASAQAITRYREALDEYLRADAWLGVAQALEGLGHALTVDHQPMRAAQVLGAAEALRGRLGAPRSPDETTRYQEAADTLRALLGDETFSTALARGHELPVEQIVAALRSVETTAAEEDRRASESAVQPNQPPDRRSFRRTPPMLSPREHQIAELVAAGLTNREIAARLQIAPRTADTHVANVLAKLDLRTRAEVGPWLRANM